MDEYQSLYLTIRGLHETSLKTGVPVSTLGENLQWPGTVFRGFFDKVLECIQFLAVNSSLETACEYFSLSPEFVKMLLDHAAEKNYLKSIEETLKKDRKTPVLSVERISQMSILKRSDHQELIRTEPRVLPNQFRNELVVPQVISIVYLGSVSREIQPVRTSFNACQNTELRRKEVKLSQLLEHKPLTGDIHNPDYSYNPNVRKSK